MKIENVKINGASNLIGCNDAAVTVSWEITEQENPELILQRIIISSDIRGEHVIAEKKDAALNAKGEEITAALEPRTRYFVLVQAVDKDMHPAQSEASVLETGKMDETWEGKIVSGDGEGIFLKDLHIDTASGKLGFATDLWHTTEEAVEAEKDEEDENASSDTADRRVVSARFYVDANNGCKVRVNGMEAVTTEDTGVYDVTDLIGEDNLIEVETKDSFRGELHIRYIDGEETFSTDGEWLFRKKGSNSWDAVVVK